MDAVHHFIDIYVTFLIFRYKLVEILLLYMCYYVYIIKSEHKGLFYYGQTQDLQSRIAYHNKGYSRFTKSHLPWILFAYKKFGSRAEAMKTERKLKNIKSKEKVTVFINKKGFTIV